MIRALDWTLTPLGMPENWPQPLKTLVALMLASPQPMFMAWGAERTWIYNDAFVPILGVKHPNALGRPALEEVWREAADVLTPLFDSVFAGESVNMQDFAILLDRRGRLEEAHFAFSYIPVHDEEGQIAGLFGSCIETTERVLAERRTAQERAWQERLFLQAPSFMCILEGPDHIFKFVNNAHRKLFYSDDWVGKPIAEAFPAAVAQGFVDLLDRVYRTGERYVARSAPISYSRSPGEPVEERLLDFIYEPTLDEFGRVIGVFCEGFDVTEARRAEEHRAMLLDELNHRVKNTLAVVQAIARQTLKPDGDPAGIRKAFEGRLAALAAAHDALTRTNWTRTTLEDISECALGASRAVRSQVKMAGPLVALEPKAAITLSLVLHELCTNAMKYGALSNSAGTVDLSWRVSSKGELALHWRESNGPPVAPPSRRGFGTAMIERAVAHDISGRVSFEYHSEGLVCAINAMVNGAD